MKTLSKGQIEKISWFYFIAVLVQMIANNMINVYVSFYATERMLLSATVMATVLSISRITDLVIGTLSGIIVQKTCFKFGQYRTWLLYGPMAVHLGSTLCFLNPGVPDVVKMAMLFIGYLAYGTGMSFTQLGQNGLIPKIAGEDGGLRTKLSGRVAQAQNIARLVASAMIVPMIGFFDSKGVDGYSVTQVIFCVIALVGQSFLFMAVKEIDKYDPDFKAAAASRIGILKILKTAVTNLNMVILLVSDVLRFTVMQVVGQLGSYYFTYVAGDFSMMAVSGTAQGFASTAGAFLCPIVCRRIGKKRSAMLSGICMTLAMGYLAFLSAGTAWDFIICNCIVQFTFCFMAVQGPNLYIDAGEYQYYKTGVDNRTFSTSIFGIASKFSWMFVGIVLAFVLNTSGYDGAAKTVENIDLMKKLIGGIPFVMFLCYTLIMTFAYRLDEDKVKEAYAANAAKDAAAKG